MSFALRRRILSCCSINKQVEYILNGEGGNDLIPTIMKEQMEVSIRVTPQQAFDFIKQQVDANEGFDEDTRPVRVHDSAYLKQLLES